MQIKKKLFKYLEAGKITLIGSDCHNLTTRAPEYGPGTQEIIKKCGKNALKELLENSNLLANGKTL